jgi:hypothetical protein
MQNKIGKRLLQRQKCENARLLKIVEEHPEDLSYLTSPLHDPIREEANAGTHNVCRSYYYNRRISMLVI